MAGQRWACGPDQAGAQGENKGFLVAKQKSQTTVERLCRFHTAPFAQFLEYVLGLSFCETPSYSLCQALFEPLLEEANLRPMARSYQVATQAKVRPGPAAPRLWQLLLGCLLGGLCGRAAGAQCCLAQPPVFPVGCTVHRGAGPSTAPEGKGWPQVGSKRGRTAEEAPAEQLMRDPSGAPRKRFRASAPSSQFLTVYNHRHTLKQRCACCACLDRSSPAAGSASLCHAAVSVRPSCAWPDGGNHRAAPPAPEWVCCPECGMPCRYHYNVSTQRLDTHISYGVRDKLTISSVTSYSNLWAVVMDCDTQVPLGGSHSVNATALPLLQDCTSQGT